MIGRTSAIAALTLEGERVAKLIVDTLRQAGYRTVAVNRMMDEQAIRIVGTIDGRHWEQHNWPLDQPLGDVLAKFSLVARARQAEEHRAIEPHPINWEDL